MRHSLFVILNAVKESVCLFIQILSLRSEWQKKTKNNEKHV
jgi:hypothetical protein